MKKTMAIRIFYCCALILLLLGGCYIERTGLREAMVSWDVAPVYFCPGDPVIVSWDFSDMPKSVENCRRPGSGGFHPPITCVASSDCPADGGCVDGYCCRRALPERNPLTCPDGRGCYPDFEVTITGDSVVLEPPVDGENLWPVGSRTVTPSDTTTFQIEGWYNPPPTRVGEEKTAVMVTPVPETDLTIDFVFFCAGSVAGWAFVDLDRNIAAEHVRIVGVRNTSGHIIELTGGMPTHGPVTLNPGEITATFNGPVGGRWAARLSPLDRASLSQPICRPTDVENPWPDLQVELVLDCVVDEDR